jgi:prepilin peptidase dependent protein B
MTLVELMIGLVVGLIAMGSVITVWGMTVRSSTEMHRAAKLNQDLRTAMQLMTAEIRRAGYWGYDGATGGASRNNPFMTEAMGLGIHALAGTDGRCIVFTYDQPPYAQINAPGAAPEYFGYRLANRRIELISTSAEGRSTDHCSAPGWQGLTDEQVVDVTDLRFELETKCMNAQTQAPCQHSPQEDRHIYVDVRTVTVSLTGRLVDHPEITMTLNEGVRLRNDRVYQYDHQ